MRVGVIDPLTDPRWRTIVERHPAAGIFHTPEWLLALQRTYRYQTLAYVGLGFRDEIICGIPFCKVRSLITGRRLVSLPFSDHCQPLVSNADELNELLSAVQSDVRRQRLNYVEIRPISDEPPVGELQETSESTLHRLDLSRGEKTLLNGFHKSCILRKLRSEDALSYAEDRSDRFLAAFYRLLVLTRRRHQIPPQPFAWFKHLRDCMGEALSVHLALKDEIPVASIVTLSFKHVLTYKYSCSDSAYNADGGTIRLMWRVIRNSAARGALELDLGRSDLDNSGLIAFKNRWGSVQTRLLYFRYPAACKTAIRPSPIALAAKRLLTRMPDRLFTAVGGLLYRHVG
jgi:GNAT acetyltransferase-like protein